MDARMLFEKGKENKYRRKVGKKGKTIPLDTENPKQFFSKDSS